MGKTLTQILIIGAAVGVAVVSGGIATGLSAAAIGTIATVATTIAVTTGLQLAGSVLGLGPNAPKPDTTSTAIKTARPPRFSAYGRSRAFGAYILFETSATNGTAVDVYAFHDGRADAIEAHYLGDDVVTLVSTTVQAGADNRYGQQKVHIYTTLGQAVGTAFADLITILPGIWTTNHRGDGVVIGAVTWGAVKSKDYLEIYPNQQPALSLVARWQRCPDPAAADPTDEAGWTWTENPIRHLMHYKMVRENVDYATKIAPTISYWIAAAAVCDAPRTLKAGGTEAWYRSSVAHNHTTAHGTTVAALLTTCDGWMAPRADGALVIYAGKYYVPTVTIGPDEIVSYDWNGVGVDDDKAVNEIICNYISAANDYNTVETDAWIDEDDIAERGQVLSASLDPQVPSWGQVRFLAKRKMARTNALNRGTVTTTVAGRAIRGERYIWLNLTEAGVTFYDGPVEITAVTRNMQTGGMTFSWVSVDPNIDSWNPATEEGNPAAVGDRVAAEPLDTPTIDSTSVTFFDGGAQISIDAVGPSRDDLSWFIRWKVSTDIVWAESSASDTDPGPDVVLVTGLVPINETIDVAVAYMVGDGRVSAWSTTSSEDTSVATTPPAAPTSFIVTGGVGQAVADWINPTTPSFTDIRLYRNTVNDFSTSSIVVTQSEPLGGPGTYTDTGLSAGTYYYWIRSLGTGGTSSSEVASGAVTVT